jgi:hypothetical protein
MQARKQHPYASAAVGAGAGLLLAEGARRAISAFSGERAENVTAGGGAPQGRQRQGGNDEDESAKAEGSARGEEDEGDEGGEEEADITHPPRCSRGPKRGTGALEPADAAYNPSGVESPCRNGPRIG